jgi:hypothetical protein
MDPYIPVMARLVRSTAAGTAAGMFTPTRACREASARASVNDAWNYILPLMWDPAAVFFTAARIDATIALYFGPLVT